MTHNLKECPFCGREAAIMERQQGVYELAYIRCKNVDCRAAVGGYDNKQDAINNWNKRS